MSAHQGRKLALNQFYGVGLNAVKARLSFNYACIVLLRRNLDDIINIGSNIEIKKIVEWDDTLNTS